MKISIAMATYNGAAYIMEQLQSFADQTLLPDELIVTDDCSTDKTEDIVRAFARTAPFEVIFHRNEKNLGYCGNFNAALMKTTGDLVFLSDQDDFWFPEKIETMLSLAEKNPDMLVLMNDTELTDGELNSVGLTKLGQIKSAGLSLNSYVIGCCCAVRRELLDICMPIPEGFRAHDNWIVEFAAGLDGKLVDKTVLQYYRRHESNESQFIANRTVKVRRHDVFMHRFKFLIRKDRKELEARKILQDEIFLQGLKASLSRTDDARREELQVFIMKKEQQLKISLCRKEIRALGFFKRVLAIISLYRKSCYGQEGGLKAMVKDFFG